MKITIKEQPEFQQIFNQYVELNNFEYKFLKHYLDQVIESEKIIYETSYLYFNEDSWILLLHGEMLYIYGEKWNDELINEFSKSIDLSQFTNFEVVGNSALIQNLIERFKIKNRKIIKERTFYKTSTINDVKINENYKIRNAKIEEENEIALMLQKYYEEEYNGQNNKTIEEMKAKAKQLINFNNIYLLLDNNKIVGFCTLINPDVGILFTKVEERSKGYGKVILSYCAKKLLNYNQQIYLMTDKASNASNIVVRNVGFKEYFAHLHIQINCR